jgi:hypothetical protein
MGKAIERHETRGTKKKKNFKKKVKNLLPPRERKEKERKQMREK